MWPGGSNFQDRVRPGQEEKRRWHGPRPRALWPPWGRATAKSCAWNPPSVPRFVQTSLLWAGAGQAGSGPTGSTWPPTSRRLPGRRGCLPAGRSQAQEADGAELRGERPAVGPQKLRARPFEWPFPRDRPPGLNLSLQQPRGLLGGAHTNQSLDSDPKRDKGVWVVCRGRSCREPPQLHNSVPFHQVCPRIPALRAIPPSAL